VALCFLAFFDCPSVAAAAWAGLALQLKAREASVRLGTQVRAAWPADVCSLGTHAHRSRVARCAHVA
jgi:hypothetical protein